MKYAILIVIVAALFGCQTTRGVTGSTFYSESAPSAMISTSSQMKYIGMTDISYQDGAGLNKANINKKSYIFVEVASNNIVKSIFIIMYFDINGKYVWNADVFEEVEAIDRKFCDINGTNYHQIVFADHFGRDEIVNKLEQENCVLPSHFISIAIGKVVKKTEKMYIYYGLPYDADNNFKSSKVLSSDDVTLIEELHKSFEENIHISEYIPQ